ncbi:hypothetical protein QM467_15715 [Rhodoblastus sp. 17X3]|uniref:hypothetical protein n=1 Tax=Rhodoblastus sp. 17X3 TaxID=3047026 RepID=UPI0024B81EE4|nr:hypothetical protein [Rhodoblastus sp. 17X3]MDI9849504.1 hypothetical protein [Rhodoblastus sp. 17X3]
MTSGRNHPQGSTMARDQIWLWLAGGLSVLLAGAALALWAIYGPLVFVSALNAAWTCF